MNEKKLTTEEILNIIEEHFGIGCKITCQERYEQIHKHGFDDNNDRDYSQNELLKASLFAMNPDQFEWPFNWMSHFRDKIIKKSEIDRLKISASFIIAQIDRLHLYNKNN